MMINTLALVLSQAVVFPQQADISLEVTGSNNPENNWYFFAPHENEHVVNQYLAHQVQNKGGVFVVLRQSGDRYIELNIDKDVIRVDPNRIFTALGRASTITKLNPAISTGSKVFLQAKLKAKQLSEFILAAIGGSDKSNTWVAIHNNSNGYDHDGKNGIGNVSISYYQQKLLKGAKYLIDVTASAHDEDDLFFVTDSHDFDMMRKNAWNAVLQNPDVATDPDEDDGSLSVYAEMQGIRYINVEAERVTDGFGIDHLSVQKSMVDFTFSLLEKSQKIK